MIIAMERGVPSHVDDDTSLSNPDYRRKQNLSKHMIFASMTCCISRALVHLHDIGIEHGDLKLRNTVYTTIKPGIIAFKVIDFGNHSLDDEQEFIKMIGNVLTWDIISKPGDQYAPLNYITLFTTHTNDRDGFGEVSSAGEAEDKYPEKFEKYSRKKLIPQSFPKELKLLEDITNVKEIKGKYEFKKDVVKRHKLLKEFSEDVNLASKMWEFAKDVSIEEIKESISGFTWNGRNTTIDASIRMNGVNMYLEKILL